MTLLTSMMERPLDPGYAAAAQRRAAAGLPAATSLRSGRLIVAALVLGLLLGGGASALRRTASTKSQARSALTSQIEHEREVGESRTVQIQSLRREINDLDARLLGTGTTAAMTELSLVAGAVAATGPGFVVTLDDAPEVSDRGSGADPRAVQKDTGAVLAVDLQAVVNGLWGAGAEVVGINGQRLTSTSSIRFAGRAILVDYRPLTRPYVVSAIGNPAHLPAAFAEGPAGTYVATLHSTYGVVVSTQVRSSITVPAAVGVTIREARPLVVGDTGGGSPHPSPQESP